jgi:hypothetical protein
MRWDHSFRDPLMLLDGRTVRTLGDARDLVLSLPAPHQQNPHWRYASELLFKAADRGEKYAVMDARAQMARALKAEGLLLSSEEPSPGVRAIRAHALRAKSRFKRFSASGRVKASSGGLKQSYGRGKE